MNHSIYSADRTTHLKIVVVALVAGIAVAGFGISARSNSDDLHADGARDQGRQAGGGHELRRSVGSLTEEFTEFTRLFTSPPKSPRGYVEDPNYPQVDYSENARSPRAFSFLGSWEWVRAQRFCAGAAQPARSRSACR